MLVQVGDELWVNPEELLIVMPLLEDSTNRSRFYLKGMDLDGVAFYSDWAVEKIVEQLTGKK